MDSDLLLQCLSNQNIQLPNDQVEALDRYRRLLLDWNEKINLTRHLDPAAFVERDVTDALAIAQFLEPNEEILDVGTGGGVPGVLLGILREDLSVSLCESVAKKAKAVDDMVEQLQLPIPVFAMRAEALFQEGHSFDTLVLRAVARLDKLLRWFQPYWGNFRRLLVVKGPKWTEERQACRERHLLQNLELRRLHSWPLPHTDVESVLLEIKPSTKSRRVG